MIIPYTGKFCGKNFCENGNFKDFTENVFTNDPHGQEKRCGMATLSQNKFL